ncbi:hypothetical protein LB579_31760 [Mesorhizobium sp. BR1-1-7]|uniref:hypothetical protein n=1 Tax=Mesorhizobium sp. BR1-1-7 TaxID=2876647 RepID=UPI001CC9D48F|nr:hypothetical protein [Mesorhizobium sp. BR1-1-7]MBZ9922255.1 hypothetical protein [Mesorhizobium sp. BR1-1-7]
MMARAMSASRSEADVVITTHHRHQHHGTGVYNEDGGRLHHRHHGQVAFYDNGKRAWHRHHRRPDTVVVTGSMHRQHHRPVVIQQDDSVY